MGTYPPLGQLGPRAIAEWGIRTQTASVTLEGRSHIPAHGPVMLVARHFHHLLDGAVLLTRTTRPIHIVVGLDWVASAGQRRWLERMCRAAQYPVVLRRPTLERSGSYRREELVRYTRAALRETTTLLRAGRVVLVFPEGYPNVDPALPQKRAADEWLPFEPGFLKMIEIAEGDGKTQVALVPVGFFYQPGRRWSITARIGPPVPRAQRVIGTIESAVRRLSSPEPITATPAGTPIGSVSSAAR